MKKLISILLLLLLLCIPALADGDTNIDGSGGGGTGSGSGSSAWNPGDDGVRVTILQGTTPVSVLDYSNVQRSRTQQSFKKQCKLYYKNGGQLVPRFDQYTNIVPTIRLPRVISSDGGSNIDAIKKSFTTSNRLQDLARDAGLKYDDLINGAYKLMLEPISYFKYNDVQYAMTATEAALFDVKVDGKLSYWMGRLTHQNQPLSMYLERADLGIQPWTGSTSGKQSDINILKYLGVGIVTFKPAEEVKPPEGLGDYVYRTDTDVITATYVSNWNDYDIKPASQKYLTFQILGRSYRKQYVCPSLSGQLVWVRWHTPSTPQDIEIYVSNGTTIKVSIVDIPDVEPPDPQFEDTNPRFRLEKPPKFGEQTSATWSEWLPVRDAFGRWYFDKADYKVSLKADYELKPDARVKTAVRYPDTYEMKSGYGVNASCDVRVFCGDGVSDLDVTPVQNVMALFPEFSYKTYNRLLTPEDSDRYKTTWTFKNSVYSYYNRPVHFVPLWYPDRTEYPVPLAVFDVWTPAGQLYTTETDSVRIDGNVLDDWYIRVTQ